MHPDTDGIVIDSIETALTPACDGARAFLEFWRAACPAPERFPAQGDLNLTALGRLIAHAYILDVLEDRRFRYRFVGTHIDRQLGRSITGLRIDEYRTGDALRSLTELFGTVCEQVVGGHMLTRMSSETSEIQVYERIAVPLSDDGETVNKIAGAWFNHWPDDADHLPLNPTPGIDLDQTAMMRLCFFDPFDTAAA
jgi:hypothetical protein